MSPRSMKIKNNNRWVAFKGNQPDVSSLLLLAYAQFTLSAWPYLQIQITRVNCCDVAIY